MGSTIHRRSSIVWDPFGEGILIPSVITAFEQVLLPLGPKGDGTPGRNFDYGKSSRSVLHLFRQTIRSCSSSVMLFNEELVGRDYRILVECSEEDHEANSGISSTSSLHVLKKYLQAFFPDKGFIWPKTNRRKSGCHPRQ